MKLNRLFVAIAATVMLASGCYRDEIDSLKEQIESFKQTSIDPIGTQVNRVKESLGTLENAHNQLQGTVNDLSKTKEDLQARLDATNQKLDALISSQAADNKELQNQLNTLKTDLEDKLKIVNASIDALVAKDKELEGRIDDIKKFLDDQLSDVWGEFKKTSEIIAGIDASIEALRTSIENIYQSLSDRISEVQSGLKDDIKASVADVTRDYEDAISRARTEILFTVDEKIVAAIDASKDKILGWINEDLTKHYYNKAETDALLDILKASDANVQTDLDELKSQLESTSKVLEKAIEDAIKNAQIDERIAKAINDLSPRLKQIDDDLIFCLAEISTLDTRVTTLEQQAEKIMAAIEALQNADTNLDSFIKELQAIAAKLQSDMTQAQSDIDDNKDKLGEHRRLIDGILENLNLVNTQIEQLQAAKDAISGRITELSNTVTELRTSIDSGIADTKEWANKTFATLDEYKKTVEEVEAIKVNIEGIKTTIDNLDKELSAKIDKVGADVMAAISKARTDLETAYTAKIAESIGALDESIRGWVSSTLEADYIKAADIQAKLDALKAAYEGQDALHEADIAKLQEDLSKLQGEIEQKCQDCIAAALLEGGAIDSAIKAKFLEFKSGMDDKLGEIDGTIEGLNERLTTLEEKIQSVEGQLGNMQSAIESLQQLSQTLDKYISDILHVMGDTTKYEKSVINYIQDLDARDKELKKMINDLESSITSGSIATTIKGWIDGTAANYYTSDKVDELLGAINTDIDNIAKRVTDLEARTADDGPIMAAVNTLRQDVTDWLTDYYTKSDIDTKFTDYYKKAETYSRTELDKLLSDNYYTASEIKAKIDSLGDVATKDDLKKAVDDAKKELTDKYTAAIEEAIKNHKGIVDSTFDAIRGGYQGSLMDLKKKIDTLSNRIGNLEAIIQSIVFIPEFQNGAKMTFSYDEETGDAITTDSKAVLKFRLGINGTFDVNKYYFKANLKNVQTRAAGDAVDSLVVTNKSFADGILTIELAGDTLGEDFYGGAASAAVSIMVSEPEGASRISSAYIPLYPRPDKELEFSIDPTAIVFDFKGGVQTVTVNCPSATWTVSSVKGDWITWTPGEFGTFDITVPELEDSNKSGRSGSVTVKFGAQVRVLTVKQRPRGAQVLQLFPSAVKWKWDTYCDYNEQGTIAKGIILATYRTVEAYAARNDDDAADEDKVVRQITVASSDGESDWYIDESTVPDWLDYNSHDGYFSLYPNSKNTSGEEKIGAITVYSHNGDAYELIVTQDRRVQSISVNPDSGSWLWNQSGSGVALRVDVTLEPRIDDFDVRNTLNMDAVMAEYPWLHCETGREGSLISGYTYYFKFYPVSNNEAVGPREAVITFTSFSGEEAQLVLTQEGSGELTITGLNPSSLQWASWDSKDAKSVTVSTSNGLANWHIENLPLWLNQSRDQGSNTITFTPAAANDSQVEESATIKFVTDDGKDTKELPVSRPARPVQAIAGVSPSEYEWKWDETSFGKTITVTTEDGTNDWTVDESTVPDWLNVDKTEDGNGILLFANQNDTGSDRVPAVIKFINHQGTVDNVHTFTAKQTKRPVQKISSLSATSHEWTWNEGAFTLTVNTEDNTTDWTVDETTLPTWLTATHNPTENTVVFTATNNETGSDRGPAVVKFKTNSGAVDEEHTFTVSQKARPEQQITAIAPASKTWKWNETNAVDVVVTTNDDGTDWTVDQTTVPDWLTAVHNDGDNFVRITPKSKNQTSADFGESVIKFKNNKGVVSEITFSAKQTKRDAQTITKFDPESLEWSWRSTDGKAVTVTTSDGETDWKISEVPDWLNKSEDKTNGKVTFTPKSKNNSKNARSGNVVFKSFDDANSYNYPVKQTGYTFYLDNVDIDGSTISVSDLTSRTSSSRRLSITLKNANTAYDYVYLSITNNDITVQANNRNFPTSATTQSYSGNSKNANNIKQGTVSVSITLPRKGSGWDGSARSITFKTGYYTGTGKSGDLYVWHDGEELTVTFSSTTDGEKKKVDVTQTFD